MTSQHMTDQQLIDFSGEHLMHELSMLWELAAILPQRKASTETSAFIESFGVHLRNLIDFFYRQGKGDDVTAQDFLDVGIRWKPTEPPVLRDAHTRANKELNHLTQLRKSGAPKDKEWDTARLLSEIDAVARDFAAKASPKKLHPKIFEFLKQPANNKVVWIGDNVIHSNVASRRGQYGHGGDPPDTTDPTHLHQNKEAVIQGRPSWREIPITLIDSLTGVLSAIACSQ